MEQKAAKRFYKEVSYQAQPAGFEVYLDSRSLKTPAKQPLLLPNEASFGKRSGCFAGVFNDRLSR